ncbi:MAG: transposase [Pseudomonadota bacterium]
MRRCSGGSICWPRRTNARIIDQGTAHRVAWREVGDPTGVVYFHAPGCSGVHAEGFLASFDGIPQPDGYPGHHRLTRPSHTGGDPIKVAHCRGHGRRKLREIFDRDGAEIAAEGLRRIAEFYEIKDDICGVSPDQRLSALNSCAAPLIEDFGIGLTEARSRVSVKSRLGEKLGCIHRHWDGLQTFLTDGRVEIASSSVENLVRPVALNRKSALFAGHDAGVQNWALIASQIETC